MLYAVSVLIMVRSVFRVIEYAMGYNGCLLKNERSLYIFDALPMFSVVAMFPWRFPGHLKAGKPTNIKMAREETLEMQSGDGDCRVEREDEREDRAYFYI